MKDGRKEGRKKGKRKQENGKDVSNGDKEEIRKEDIVEGLNERGKEGHRKAGMTSQI